MRSDFQNPATQDEKVEVLRNEAALRAGDRAPTTLHALAGVDQALESGGRFKSEVLIVGATPAPAYPAAASPWSGPQVGLEPSTGLAIDAVEPVGTAKEIEASQLAAEPAAPVTASDSSPPAVPAEERGSAAILAHRRLQELAPKMFRKRKL